jgi:hypothetical protein
MIYQKKGALRSFMICNVKLTIHLCIVLKLRMSGTIPLLYSYVFIAWTGAVLPFTVIKLG